MEPEQTGYPEQWDDATWRDAEADCAAFQETRGFPVVGLAALVTGLGHLLVVAVVVGSGWPLAEEPWATRLALIAPALLMVIAGLVRLRVRTGWASGFVAVAAVAGGLFGVALGVPRFRFAHAWPFVIAWLARRDAFHPVDAGTLGVTQVRDLGWVPSRYPTRYLPAWYANEPAATLPHLDGASLGRIERLEERVRRLRDRHDPNDPDVVSFTSGRERWRMQLHAGGALAARLEGPEWRAVARSRFRIRPLRVAGLEGAADRGLYEADFGAEDRAVRMTRADFGRCAEWEAGTPWTGPSAGAAAALDPVWPPPSTPGPPSPPAG